MSAFGGKAEVFHPPAKSPLIAISGHLRLSPGSNLNSLYKHTFRAQTGKQKEAHHVIEHL
jgi:hypothetical protein